MVYIQNHWIALAKQNTIKQGSARSFYGNISESLLSAQKHGEVFSLPEFLQALTLSSFEGPLTGVPFTVQTEEIIGKSKQGNSVTVVVHGPGLLTAERITQGIVLKEFDGKIPDHGLTRTISGRGQFALPLFNHEVEALLEGRILPVYSYTEFKAGISNLPRRYAVVRDFHPRKEIPEGYQFLSTLKVLPRLISLAGGVENLECTLDLLAIDKKIDRMGYFHPFRQIDPDQPQGRFIEIHGVHHLFYSFREMDGTARFLSVKKEELEERISGISTIDYE